MRSLGLVTPEVADANYKTFQSFVKKAHKSLSDAIEADERQATKRRVLALYRMAVRDITSALSIKTVNCTADKRGEVEIQKKKLESNLKLTHGRMTDLEKIVLEKHEPSVSFDAPDICSNAKNSQTSSNAMPSTRTKDMFLRNVNRNLGEEIYSTIIQRTGVKLSDIEGNAQAKEALQQSVIYPTLNPQLYTGLRAPSKGILLYGPPGNGKTMIAKAAAEEAKCTFFNISASTIMSKWVGEGEKMVKTLFQIARNAQPSIIFIDEIDSMLCERSENENGAARRVKTEFLLQMDGCANQADDRILVLGATNRPQELDDGVIRRFPQRIFIDLPDAGARRSLITMTFKQHKTAYQMSNRELDEIANMTDGYSFSDLLAVCRAAAMMPLNGIDTSKLPKISADKLRPVNCQDMITAIKNTRPSTSIENRRKLHEFASGSESKSSKKDIWSTF
ncbi:ATPase family associated with various cellular activities (AAA) domain-containing protein [Ditylenchus destructor]|nr:ATPase family associated with various cellular activities (AAA) domain-containing protein [Ditylenchus destructor]